MKFELLLDYGVELAETPIWDPRIGKWYWNDLFKGTVYRFTPETGKSEEWETGGMIGSAVPCKDPEKLLVVLENGAHLLDLATGELSFIVDPDKGIEHNRYNDSRVDAAGRLFMSSVHKAYGTDKYSPDMLGNFYMVEADRKTVRVVVEGIQQYNAIVWNRENTKMFVVDTYNQTLLCFPYDLAKGPTGIPEVVLDFTPKGTSHGMPDGMSIDTQDNLYICHWTGKITVWDSKISLVREVQFPVEYVCCGGFGGKDMQDYVVATSKYCYTDEQLAKNKGAGGLFTTRNEIPGRPDYFY